MAVHIGLSDLALQAVDGTKMAGNVAQHGAGADWPGLMRRTQAAIAELEDQNEAGEHEPPPSLPQEMREASDLGARIREAREGAPKNGTRKTPMPGP